MTAPTVEDLLQSTALGNGLHNWPCSGGAIRVSTDELRQALEDAYDPLMPNWVALVEIDDA